MNNSPTDREYTTFNYQTIVIMSLFKDITISTCLAHMAASDHEPSSSSVNGTFYLIYQVN